MNRKVLITVVGALCVYAFVNVVSALAQDQNATSEKSDQNVQEHPPWDQDSDTAEGNEEWDPIAEMQHFKRYIKNKFHNNMREGFSRGQFDDFGIDTAFFYMSSDILENEDEYVILIDMPGMKKEDIDLSIKDGQLFVHGERNDEIAEKKENEESGYIYSRRERRFGSLKRQLTLPKDIQDDKITARYDNGVLAIIIPKVIEEKKIGELKKIRVM